jgi:mono/diheme cytochrome c family protein
MCADAQLFAGEMGRGKSRQPRAMVRTARLHDNVRFRGGTCMDRWGTTRKRLSLVVAAGMTLWLGACSANPPGRLETLLAQEAKRATLAGRDLKNPSPDTEETVKAGGEHFQHHCQICHGLDGHNTGVPFAQKMSPEVADLGQKNVQDYSDGQLKMIIQNGIRYTGMPGWQGVLEDDEMWAIVRYIRHLPAKGSLGAPAVFKEGEQEHEGMHGGPAASDHQHEHGAEQNPPAGTHVHVHPDAHPQP